MLFTCYCAFILTIVTGAAGGVTTLAKLRQSLVVRHHLSHFRPMLTCSSSLDSAKYFTF
jgi:hypothetical protein